MRPSSTRRWTGRTTAALRSVTEPAARRLSDRREDRRSIPPHIGCGADNEGRCSRRWPILPARGARCDGTPGTCAPCIGVRLWRRRRIGRHHVARPHAGHASGYPANRQRAFEAAYPPGADRTWPRLRRRPELRLLDLLEEQGEGAVEDRARIAVRDLTAEKALAGLVRPPIS